jgi:hypothetical protein
MSLRDWHSRVEKVWRATEGMCLGWFLGWVRRLLAEGFYGWVSRLSVTGLGALPFFVEDPLEEVGGEEEEVVVGGGVDLSTGKDCLARAACAANSWETSGMIG